MDLLVPVIRRATVGDEHTLYLMICGLENTEMDRDAFNFVFRRNVGNKYIAYFIAEIEGVAAGMASCHIQTLLHHVAFVAEIQEMFVYEEFRSRNIGKALMQQVADFAKTEGAIQLEVTSRSYREDAHRFYQREGFEKSHVKLVRYF